MPVVGESRYNKAFLSMFCSTLCFASMVALVKHFKDYPLSQVIFFRSSIALIFLLFFFLAGGRVALLRTRRPHIHLLRAVFGLSSMLLTFYAFRNIPIANASALIHTKALFIIIFAVPLLKETFSKRRFLLGLIGLIGIVLMLNPVTPKLNLGTVAALLGAILAALAMICVRSLSKTEPVYSVVFYFMLFATAVSAHLSIGSWRIPETSFEMVLLCAIGLSGILGQLFMVLAYKSAEASFVAPFDYMQLLWATMFGVFIWQEIPDLWLISGAILVVYSQVALKRSNFDLSP